MDISIQVLVVEDTPIAQTIIKLHMTKEGCKVDIAADGTSALEKANTIYYDLILMDIGLGDGPDGFEVTSQIKSQSKINSNTPIIAISAHGEREFIEKAEAVGIKRYFTKPFTPAHAKDIMEYFNNLNKINKPS